jgi:amino acid transporter
MLGTGVMIGAGIFALTGQMAQMTGVLFPLAFLAAALIVGFSAYSYIKISNAYPSAGGIGMYLHKAYGNRLPTAFNALLMYFSMASLRASWPGPLALTPCNFSAGMTVAAWCPFSAWRSFLRPF